MPLTTSSAQQSSSPLYSVSNAVLPTNRTRAEGDKSPLHGRNIGLDLLRLVAVVLVIVGHSKNLTFIGGWIGVDLFFVLSGFLVSGLLLREYARTGGINVGRFLVRRAWKIYPAFWLMISFTLFIQTFVKSLPAGPPTLKATLAELMFVQNYIPGLWGHTWTLAVEEHFYIGLALLFGFLVQRQAGPTPPLNCFAVIPLVCGCLALSCLVLRIATNASHCAEPYDWFIYCGTHLRIDSLFFGVLLAYLCHFQQLHLRLAAVPSVVLVGAGLVCLSPAFMINVAVYHWVWAGLVVLLYIGAGFLVLAATRLTVSSNLVVRLLAALGAASYSIYLWHMAVNIYCTRLVERTLGLSDYWVYFLVYFGGSLALGWLMSRLVELPILTLRDRLFPSQR